jgi:hypothetical protein
MPCAGRCQTPLRKAFRCNAAWLAAVRGQSRGQLSDDLRTVQVVSRSGTPSVFIGEQRRHLLIAHACNASADVLGRAR